MKKLMMLLLVLIMIFSLAACDSENGSTTPSKSSAPTESSKTSPAEGTEETMAALGLGETGEANGLAITVDKITKPGSNMLYTCFYYPNLALGGETSDKIPLTANLMDWLFDVAKPLGPMMKQIGEVSTACGVAFSGAQVCYAIYQNESDALIAAEAYKSAYQTAIAYYNSYGPYAMKFSMLGVIAIDYSLNRFLDETNQTYKNDIYTIVKYYNEKETPRTDKQWYDMIIKLYRQRGDNPKKFKSALEGLIYNFSARFFQLDYNAQSNTAGFAGKKLPYITLDAQNYCVEQYVARLGERLQPVLKDVMKQISYEANKDYRTNLKKLTALLNQNIIIDVLEEIPGGEKSVYAKSTVALVQGENNPGKNPKNDKPDLTQGFVLSDKVTSVVLKDTGHRCQMV